MNTYLEIKGGKQVGPLVQHFSINNTEENIPDIHIDFLMQSDKLIEDMNSAYRMKESLKVDNCLYARFIGPEDKIKFAYDKLGVYAFENDIPLSGENYTVYVNRDEEEEVLTADIFMPIAE